MTRPARYLLPLLFFLVAGYFLVQVRNILFPFVLAATLAYLLNPLVSLFEIRGLRRNTVVLILYVTLLGLGVFGAYHGIAALNQEITQARAEWPTYQERGQNFLHKLKEIRSGKREWESPLLRQIQPLKRLPESEKLLDMLERNWQGWAKGVLQKVPSLALQIVPLLQLTFLVPFLAYFFMVGGPSFLEKILEFVPSRHVEMVLNVAIEIDHSLGNYLRGLLLEAFIVGLLALLGFWMIGLHYAVQVSLAVGVTNLIPYVGPFVGALLGGMAALFQWQSLSGLAWVLVVCAAIQFIDSWVLQPLIMKNAVKLHPVLILFSLMAGATLWGFWGLLFAVPIACMVKVVLQIGWEWYRSEFRGRVSELPAEVHRVPSV